MPGPKSGIVFVSDAIKKGFPKDAPFPTSENGVKESALANQPDGKDQIKEKTNEPTESIDNSNKKLDSSSDQNIEMLDEAATSTKEN